MEAVSEMIAVLVIAIVLTGEVSYRPNDHGRLNLYLRAIVGAVFRMDH
jgi:hypothetical protein